MNTKELRSIALSAMDYDSCTDEMIDTMAKHILATVKEDDDELLTEDAIKKHPAYKAYTNNYGYIGSFAVTFSSNLTVEERIVIENGGCYLTAEDTWGTLRQWDRLIGSKPDSPEKQI